LGTIAIGSTIVRAHTWLAVAAAGLLSLTCRPPTLIDPLGRPVARPMLVASIETGRIVIDSSAAGVRAVAELTRTLEDSAHQAEGTVPLLRCSGRSSPLAPHRVRTEPITCHDGPTGAGCDRPRQASTPCGYPNSRIARSCSQVLHLEYRLDAVPSVGDSLSLQLVDRISRSRWKRP